MIKKLLIVVVLCIGAFLIGQPSVVTKPVTDWYESRNTGFTNEELVEAMGQQGDQLKKLRDSQIKVASCQLRIETLERQLRNTDRALVEARNENRR